MSQYKELPQVEFAVAAQNAFKKFFQFNGRIRRSEYWWGFLTLFIAAFVISLVPFVGPLVALVLVLQVFLCSSVVCMTLEEADGGGLPKLVWEQFLVHFSLCLSTSAHI